MHTAALFWGYAETGREGDRLKQLSDWLFVAPCALCFGEIINCIIRTPVIHKLFVPATEWLESTEHMQKESTGQTHKVVDSAKGNKCCMMS